MENFLNINNENFKVIDTKEKMTVPDCFVFRSNKIWSWNWEAKFYIWNEWKEIRDFFNWESFKHKCFLLKKDLLQYLEDVKDEYINPEQPYINKDKLPVLWKERYDLINTLDDILFFDIEEQTQIKWPRIYINSSDYAYKVIRELSLPNITYLSAIKLEDSKWNNLYYFRLFIDYFDEYEHPYMIEKEEEKIMEEENIEFEDKKQLIRARKWQWKYRQALLEECPFCPITLISDDRLLIASHIKPWARAELNEKTDPKNGFMLTPTYDLLFDRWFISFTNDKKIIISPWLSKMTCSKLNISPEKQYSLLPVEWRENYLDYHRNNIFKS